jgi:FMN hydrolase / 5-amino-6-(5-phospho-D-ribitylamino)uracil phosphatase
MKQPTIILDLMDTVVVDPFFHLVPSYFGMTMGELFRVKDLDSWPAFELGEIDEAEYFRRFFTPESGLQVEDPERLKSEIFSSYRFVEGMELLLERLNSNGTQLWIHSNYSPWVSEIQSRLRLDRFFTGYAMSFELKARKPDAKAFNAALARIGEEAVNCLFIDDRESNVTAAEIIGMKGIRFESAQQLSSALSMYGFSI